MSEEIQNQEVTPETTETPQESESETRARAQGWVPKEEWSGAGKWRDAETFLDRGELFDKIERQRKDLQDLRKNQAAFASHLETVRKAEFARAMSVLREEKKAAYTDGNPDAILAAEDKMRALEAQAYAAQQQVVVQPQVSSEPPQEFIEWQGRNSWYSPSNRAMVDFADAEGHRLQAQGGLSPQQILQEVETRVRREFPHKFTNPNRSKPGAVEASGNRPSNAKEDYPLTDDQRNVMNRLIRSGTMTKEDYIKDLKALDQRSR